MRITPDEQRRVQSTNVSPDIANDGCGDLGRGLTSRSSRQRHHHSLDGVPESARDSAGLQFRQAGGYARCDGKTADSAVSCERNGTTRYTVGRRSAVYRVRALNRCFAFDQDVKDNSEFTFFQ
jgi:hypothetical protein